MARFIIQGGRTLKGEVRVHGAKNHALKVLPSALLFKGPITVSNIPLIEDVLRSQDILRDLGFRVKEISPRSFRLSPPATLKKKEIKPESAEKFRASIVFAGPLLARMKVASFPHPGGCVIGKRPIDLFLDGWKAMGAQVRTTAAGYRVTAPRGGLKGADYTFRKISHTATETLMMSAVLSWGKTILRNAALEPEIPALAEFLNACGARITGAGTSTIVIEGTRGKLLKRGSCEIMPDRVDAGIMAILASLLGENVLIKKCNPQHIAVLLAHLRAVGARVREGKDWVRISRSKALAPLDIKTSEYPGLVTDFQAPFTVLLTQAEGQSLVFETVFEGRMAYIDDLNRMGASITSCDPHRAIVVGPTQLKGREMDSPDLRAGLAFVIAALVAKGRSSIGNVYQIDRGYERIDETLRGLGANIKRV